jgi:hypothetical protein
MGLRLKQRAAQNRIIAHQELPGGPSGLVSRDACTCDGGSS